MTTFIIDCPRCKAKVGAEQGVHVDSSYFDDDAGEPYGHRISVGKCLHCKIVLVGRSEQLQFQNYEGSEYDTFGDIVRVYPTLRNHLRATAYRERSANLCSKLICLSKWVQTLRLA